MILYGSLARNDRHSNGPGHPEGPERLGAVDRALTSGDLAEVLLPLEGRPARRDELARVHSAAYLEGLESLSLSGGGAIDPDTAVSAGSWDTAVAAAGMGLAAVEALEAGIGEAAFLAVRPPGHHATNDQAMGFCLLNNVAVVAAALAGAGARVLIVDWDVHHGNGTQAIFWNDPRILYASTHQWPAYPWSGRASEVGGPDALGSTINIPLPPGTTGDAARLAIETLIAPAAGDFVPDWLLISAGYDAHRDDPLADLMWSDGDFAGLTADLVALAPRSGRTIAFLEGGYNLAALGRSASATVAALAGASIFTESPTAGGEGREAVLVARRIRERTLQEAADGH